jgi:hypothetical protein
VWPNPADARMVPANASLVGEHAFSGKGVPDGFRFRVPPAQDLMPALTLNQAEKDGVTALSWNAIATARAYFVSAMGSNAKEDMVMWSSSELPDTGFGLMDYQTNAAVDRWLKEKVLLAPATTACSVPKGIFGENGGMLRLIAYGDELNLAHPPRPKDPKASGTPYGRSSCASSPSPAACWGWRTWRRSEATRDADATRPGTRARRTR